MLQEYSENSLSVPTGQSPRPRLDDRFLINLKGKDFVTYAGLLDLAHQQGLARLEVELIQHPGPDNGNEAICRAIAESTSGQIFSDWGDASPTKTNKMISAHLIRMASTRAKARALRDLTNIGITALEELGGSYLDDCPGNGNGNGNDKSRPKSRKTTSQDQGATTSTQQQPQAQTKPVAQLQFKPQKPAPSQRGNGNNGYGSNGNDNGQPGGITEPQMRAIMSLSKRKGLTEDDIEAQALEAFGLTLNSLSNKDASALIVQLQH